VVRQVDSPWSRRVRSIDAHGQEHGGANNVTPSAIVGGMHPLALRVPPVVVVLIVSTTMVAAASLTGPTLPTSTTAAVAFAALGFAIALAGVVTFKRHRTTVDPRFPDKTSTLVTRGVYRLSRNPMYLGFLLCLVGLAVQLGSVVAWALLPLFVVYMNRFQIGPEEVVLQAAFGDAFTTYRRQVRRWL
jgi:protein-S-isoprenylcysteine O-methyltransferase Ste14